MRAPAESVTPSVAFGGDCTPRENTSLLFANCGGALATARIDQTVRADYAREIAWFEAHCRPRQAVPSVSAVRNYLAREPRGATLARDALRWLWRSGRNRRGVGHGTPPPARTDLGGADWERDLIKASRGRGFPWRTETTDREWAAKFAAFVKPRSPYAADGTDVVAFLTALAVEKRASPSTQKQALNALVFFLKEGLHREPGPIDFRRARPKRRMPVVLSRDEC